MNTRLKKLFTGLGIVALLGALGGIAYASPDILQYLDNSGNRLTVAPAVGLPAYGVANRITYAASTASFTPGAAATDICTITGSASKKVRVWKIVLSGTQTTGGGVPVVLLKRSTADTAGTPVAATLVPLDSSDAAAAATVNAYTANPTAGTLVGNISAPLSLIPAPAGVSDPATIQTWDFSTPGVMGAKGPVLNSATEVLAVNLAGATPAGAANFRCDIVWTEE